MATSEICAALVLQMGSLGAIRRGLLRGTRTDCPPAGLGVLALLGRFGRLRLRELSDLLGVDLSVTSRHVSQLAKQGLVARHPDPGDRRSRVIALTEAGEDELADSVDRLTDTVAERLQDWPDEDVAQLTELLARLRDSFDPHTHAQANRTPADG